MHARPDRPLSRRALLHSAAAVGLVVAAGALAACGTSSVALAPTPGPDQTALEGLVTNEIALIRAYQVALAAHPQIGTQIRTFLADHEAHLRAVCSLADIAVPSGAPAPTPATPGAATAAVIAAQRAALAKLESAAHARYVTGARGAPDGMTAAVLASAGACEAAHAALLASGTSAA
jgi:hypothetical protein